MENYLQERFKQRAEKRFEGLLNDFVRSVLANPIGYRLKFQILNDGGEKEYIKFMSNPGQINKTFFTYNECYGIAKKITNIDDIKAELIEKFMKEDVENVLSKLDALK